MIIGNAPLFRHSSSLVLHQGLKINVLLIALLFGFGSSAFAQLTRLPAPRKSAPAISKSKIEVARKKSVSISLPFWDDFSFTPINDTSNAKSNIPLDSFWIKGESVWVNDGIGIKPPTLNVATFDGLNSNGLPYSDQVLANGFRDTLTSQPINLAEVVGADTNTVYLSFLYQWQGNGEPPDPSDYMRLEFKNDVGVWVNMMTINTRSSFDKTVFYDTIIQVRNDQVNGNRFFHDAFQFRLKNYGRQSGPYDTWNIDYIYLNKGRTSTDDSFPDRAAASSISALFGEFYSVPLKHFFSNKTIDNVSFDVKNLKNNTDFISVSYDANANFINHINSVPTFHSTTLASNEPVGNLGGLMMPRERITVALDQLPDPDDVLQFDPTADSIEVVLNIDVISGDEIDAGKVAFVPYDLRINDTISTHYYLKNYYAYDDGTAEYSAGLTRAGNKLAYQFTRSATIPDSLAILNGFDIYFPDFAIVNSPTVDFTIYADDGGMPGTVLYTIPSYQIKRKGTNIFQFVRIGEPFLVGKTYYIGWKAPISGAIIVGLDASNNTGDKMIVYTNGSWAVNDAVEGSLMIRPHFGKADIVIGIEEETKMLSVFPNPSKGEFYVKGKYDWMEIISVTGQSISFTSLPEEDGSRISIPNPTSGLYILKIVSGNTLHTKKIVID